MLTRRVLWGTIIASTVFALCAAAAPAALLVADAGPQLRLLVDGQVVQVISDDHRPAQRRFPAVVPDGGRIACVGTSQGALAMVVHDLETGERRQVSTSAVAQPLTSAGRPIASGWPMLSIMRSILPTRAQVRQSALAMARSRCGLAGARIQRSKRHVPNELRDQARALPIRHQW